MNFGFSDMYDHPIEKRRVKLLKNVFFESQDPKFLFLFVQSLIHDIKLLFVDSFDLGVESAIQFNFLVWLSRKPMCCGS